jgi:integral membrane protein
MNLSFADLRSGFYATVRAPIVQILGWLCLLGATYPQMYDKDYKLPQHFDVYVYWYALNNWFSGNSLYDWYALPDYKMYPFTYPPFGAWVLSPLTWFDYETAARLMIMAIALQTAVIVALVGRSLGWSWGSAFAIAPWAAILVQQCLEPFTQSVGFAQVNTAMMALVMIDVAAPDSWKGRGVASGLAAAIKLTPAIAVLIFLLRRQWRSAITMVATSLAVTLLSWVISPGESARFFFDAMWDPQRAGDAYYTSNQNLKGFVARALPENTWSIAWAITVALALVAAVWLCLRIQAAATSVVTPHVIYDDAAPGPLNAAAPATGATSSAAPATGATVYAASAALAAPAGDAVELAASDAVAAPDAVATAPAPVLPENLATLLTAAVIMTLGLLVSPITWSHHWVWGLASVVALIAVALRLKSAPLAALALVQGALFIMAPHWWFSHGQVNELHWNVAEQLVGSSYTLAAIASGVALAWALPVQATARLGWNSLRRTNAPI